MSAHITPITLVRIDWRFRHGSDVISVQHKDRSYRWWVSVNGGDRTPIIIDGDERWNRSAQDLAYIAVLKFLGYGERTS